MRIAAPEGAAPPFPEYPAITDTRMLINLSSTRRHEMAVLRESFVRHYPSLQNLDARSAMHGDSSEASPYSTLTPSIRHAQSVLCSKRLNMNISDALVLWARLIQTAQQVDDGRKPLSPSSDLDLLHILVFSLSVGNLCRLPRLDFRIVVLNRLLTDCLWR